MLWLGGLRVSMNAQLSHFYDRKRPGREYDVYLSLRYRKQPRSANIAEVVLIPCDGHSPRPAAPAPQNRSLATEKTTSADRTGVSGSSGSSTARSR